MTGKEGLSPFLSEKHPLPETSGYRYSIDQLYPFQHFSQKGGDDLHASPISFISSYDSQEIACLAIVAYNLNSFFTDTRITLYMIQYLQKDIPCKGLSTRACARRVFHTQASGDKIKEHLVL